MKKLILDPCCWSKMFWFQKDHPNVVYGDIRSETHILCDGRTLTIQPDEIMDFRDIQYPDRSFKLIVFDPPHMKTLGKNSWMAKKYGVLWSDRKDDIKRWFDECWRVLDDYGTMIFKWSESEVPLKELLSLFHKQPLFGHTTGRNGKTIWVCFMKIPTQ